MKPATVNDACEALDQAAIEALPRRFRANLFNCLSGYKPAHLIGTRSLAGQDNLALFSSVTHFGAAPALIGMVVRPNPPGVERHTLENILETGIWTMNAVASGMEAAAHQTSAKYPRATSEFDAVGLNRREVAGFDAPFVAESPVQMGLKLAQHTEIPLNGTHLLIGEVVHVHVAQKGLREDGTLDLAALNVTTLCGLDSWHCPPSGVRFGFAEVPAAER